MTSSYRPGAWFGVFGSATTLLLPDSEKARVVALWASIDDGAGFDEVLDALLQSGLGTLPGFVLVSAGDGPTKLLARGPVLVTGTADGEPVRIDGRDALTWVERTLGDVASLTLEVGDAAGTPDEVAGAGGDAAEAVDLPIHTGLVRVARVDQPALVALAPVVAPVDAPVDALVAVGPDTEPSPLDDEADTSRVDGPGEPTPLDAAPLDAGPLDQPVDPPDAAWAATTAPPGLPPAGPPPAGPPSFEQDPLTAPLPDPEPVDAEPADVEPSDVEPALDHDGLTRTHATGEEFVRELPGIPGQPAAPRIVPPVARLVISNGESVEVDRVILIGRAPEARRFTSTEQPRLVKVPSPLHEISSTHVEVRPGSGADHGSAVVTDMGSTNGTVLDQPGLGAESLKPGIAVQLIPGATINLGDGVTIQVTRP
jgi:hypothetical protein